MTVPVCKGTLKCHRKRFGWRRGAGRSSQTSKASMGFAANGDHSRISLYNVTHYQRNPKEVGFPSLSYTHTRGRLSHFVRIPRNLKIILTSLYIFLQSVIWWFSTRHTSWCLYCQQAYVHDGISDTGTKSQFSERERRFISEGSLFFLSYYTNDVCWGLFGVSLGFHISSRSSVLISDSTHPDH